MIGNGGLNETILSNSDTSIAVSIKMVVVLGEAVVCLASH